VTGVILKPIKGYGTDGCMENPERRNNPDQPEQTNFCDWGHVQAAIIQNIKQDKPLSNYFTVLKH